MDTCTSPKTLQTIYNYTKSWKEFILQQKTRPCIDMYNIVGWNWVNREKENTSEEVVIKFTYQEKYYQELEYLPDFDLETFISNVGGFVGIFLGYSLMQVPG